MSRVPHPTWAYFKMEISEPLHFESISPNFTPGLGEARLKSHLQQGIEPGCPQAVEFPPGEIPQDHEVRLEGGEEALDILFFICLLCMGEV